MRVRKGALPVSPVWLAALCLAFAGPLGAQGIYVIEGARIHTLTGAPIDSGNVVIQDGRISAAGADVQAPPGAEAIDGSGLHVYPGLIDTVSQLGLTEISSVAATVDTTELGDFNPHLKAATAIHPASEHIPVARANGITHAVSAPGGGGGFRGGAAFGIPGQGSLIHLSGWTVEEMAIEPSVIMMLSWPTIRTRSFNPATFRADQRPFEEARKEFDAQLQTLSDWFDFARHYAQATKSGSGDEERDLKLEALADVLSGELPLMVRADEERAIRGAVEFASKQGLKMILAGGAEAWKVKELLREHSVAVVLGPSQSLPRHEDDPYDKPYTNAAELHAAGVKIAFATFGSSNSRTLPYEVGTAVAHGLPREVGIRAITLTAAEILGVDDRLGSVEPGKIANLIVTDGDPLEISTQVKHLFIKGELTSTDNKHRQLYERYRARP